MALRLQPDAYSDKAYPDGMIVCNPLPGSYQTDPVLVAEVLSESSVRRDRGDKWLAYTALASVEVYLLLSQTAAHIEVYRRANSWAQEDYLGSKTVIERAKPALKIPLAAVYANVLAMGLLGQAAGTD
jgi:Uma2 family endonuclease